MEIKEVRVTTAHEKGVYQVKSGYIILCMVMYSMVCLYIVKYPLKLSIFLFILSYPNISSSSRPDPLIILAVPKICAVDAPLVL